MQQQRTFYTIFIKIGVINWQLLTLAVYFETFWSCSFISINLFNRNKPTVPKHFTTANMSSKKVFFLNEFSGLNNLTTGTWRFPSNMFPRLGVRWRYVADRLINIPRLFSSTCKSSKVVIVRKVSHLRLASDADVASTKLKIV